MCSILIPSTKNIQDISGFIASVLFVEGIKLRNETSSDSKFLIKIFHSQDHVTKGVTSGWSNSFFLMMLTSQTDSVVFEAKSRYSMPANVTDSKATMMMRDEVQLSRSHLASKSHIIY